MNTNTNMTIKNMLHYAEKSVGAQKLWVYDARSQNCQYFIKWLLNWGSGWNSKTESFVMQNAEKVLEAMDCSEKLRKLSLI